MPAISIPASSNSIVNLLKVLATGIAISTSKADLLAVSKAAEAISIEMENWQIGVKNRGNVKVSMNENKASKKIAQKSAAKKMSNSSVTQEVLENFDEKKYSCADCGKQFGRKDHLKKHMKTHERLSSTILHFPPILGPQPSFNNIDIDMIRLLYS